MSSPATTAVLSSTRNLDIADSRAKLEQYAGIGMVGAMPAGGAGAIASRGEAPADEQLLDLAAIESGND